MRNYVPKEGVPWEIDTCESGSNCSESSERKPDCTETDQEQSLVKRA